MARSVTPICRAPTSGGGDFTDCDLRGSDLSSLDPAVARLKGAIIDMQQALSLVQAMGLDVRAD